MNVERQALDQRMLDEALEQVESTIDMDRDAGLVLVGDGCHRVVALSPRWVSSDTDVPPSSSPSTATIERARDGAPRRSTSTRRFSPAETPRAGMVGTIWLPVTIRAGAG